MTLFNQTEVVFDLNWNLDLLAQEKGRKNEIQYSGVYFKYDQDEIDDIAGKSGEETFRTPVKWVAYKDQFFSSVLIAKDCIRFWFYINCCSSRRRKHTLCKY